MSEYYDTIAPSYNELHKEEQLRKLDLVLQHTHVTGLLLDVGCGTGISTDYWVTHCECEATGIDPSSGLIAQNDGTHSTFVIGEAEAMPFDDKEFDWVVSFTAIQNFADVKTGLQEIKRVGNGNYVLTWLKTSANAALVKDLVVNCFGEDAITLEDKHDLIFIYTRRS